MEWMHYTGPVEIDAGGLLTRGSDDDRELLLIHRGGYGDWTLPKGHLEDHETLEEAAVREVREETGLEVRIIGVAGAMAYERDGRAKPVVYFFVEEAGPVVSPQPDDDTTAWLPLGDAMQRMTHDAERQFVASVLPPPDHARRRRWWPSWPRADGRGSQPRSLRARWRTWWHRWREVHGWAARLHRVQVQMTLHEIDLDALELEHARHHHGPAAAQPLPWAVSARRALQQARFYADKHRIDDAWDALHASQRYALYGRTTDELRTRAAALAEEATLKLTGWRLAAVKQQLPPPAATAGQTAATPTDARTVAEPDLAARLDAAQRVMDEHSTNVYLRLRFAGFRLVAGAALLIVLLLGLLVAVAAGAFAAAQPPRVLRDGGLFLGVTALGMTGAALSFTLARGITARRLYELTTTRVALPLARLAVGAAAAVVVVAAVQLGVLDLGPPWSVLIAVPAGFSERFLGRVIEGLDAAAGKP